MFTSLHSSLVPYRNIYFYYVPSHEPKTDSVHDAGAVAGGASSVGPSTTSTATVSAATSIASSALSANSSRAIISSNRARASSASAWLTLHDEPSGSKSTTKSSLSSTTSLLFFEGPQPIGVLSGASIRARAS